MMDGVEILSEVTCTAGNTISIVFLGIVILVSIVIITLAIMYAHEDGIDALPIGAWIISVVIIAGCIVGIIHFSKHYNDKAYKVTISDEVSFNEFLEKYEILEQDGRIYTIKEKSK